MTLSSRKDGGDDKSLVAEHLCDVNHLWTVHLQSGVLCLQADLKPCHLHDVFCGGVRGRNKPCTWLLFSTSTLRFAANDN